MNQPKLIACKLAPYQAPVFPYLCLAHGQYTLFVDDKQAAPAINGKLHKLQEMLGLREFSAARSTKDQQTYIMPCADEVSVIVDPEIGAHNNHADCKFPCIINHKDGNVYLCFNFEYRCLLAISDRGGFKSISSLGKVIKHRLDKQDIVNVHDRMMLTLSN